jgi:hypothetical protein
LDEVHDPMTRLAAYVDGIAVIGPGLADWPAAALVLSGRRSYQPDVLLLPAPVALPPAERRRVGRVTRLAIAVGLDACSRAGLDPATLATVFASSGGDGDNYHAICETLASPQRELSPTRFHNSVHNASAGYWSIATRAMAPSTALCAYDGSFAAGMLEALSQVVSGNAPALLIAYDSSYPPPLHAQRPMPEGFAVAMVLAPAPGRNSLARLTAALVDLPVDQCELAALETLRMQIPAARSLPLLARIATRQASAVVVEYLAHCGLRTVVTPC